MDLNLLNENLLKAIKGAIPTATNMATVLAEILCLGKEAIYRRIRGDVPFSFYEIAAISERLNISIDSIMGTNTLDIGIFHIDKNDYINPLPHHSQTFRDCTRVFELIAVEPDSSYGHSGNNIPIAFSSRYDEITKFNSFKWMYQQKPPEEILTYEEIEIPEELINFHHKASDSLLDIKKSFFILDKNVFSKFVNDLKYFRTIELIPQESVLKIKEELHHLLNDMDNITSLGKLKSGNQTQIYISNMNFASNYIYVESPNYSFTYVGVFVMNALTTYNKDLLENMKSVMKCQQRFSTLISESGEIQRVQYFKTQREIVNSL